MQTTRFIALRAALSFLCASLAKTRDVPAYHPLTKTKKIFFAILRMTSNSCKNEILADARMKSADADEIFGYASDEIKSTHPASSRISSNEVGFHRRRRFHPPGRVDLIEKPTSRNLSVFLSMGYEKDIFAVFAYEFELLLK